MHGCFFFNPIYQVSTHSFLVLIKGLTPIFFFLIFTFSMHVLFTNGGIILFQWKFITIESNGVMEGIYISLRLIL